MIIHSIQGRDYVLAEDCTGLRAQLDAAERKQEELEHQLSKAEAKYLALKLATSDLVRQHFRMGETCDRQLRVVCELLEEPFPGEEPDEES